MLIIILNEGMGTKHKCIGIACTLNLKQDVQIKRNSCDYADYKLLNKVYYSAFFF